MSSEGRSRVAAGAIRKTTTTCPSPPMCPTSRPYVAGPSLGAALQAMLLFIT